MPLPLRGPGAPRRPHACMQAGHIDRRQQRSGPQCHQRRNVMKFPFRNIAICRNHAAPLESESKVILRLLHPAIMPRAGLWISSFIRASTRRDTCASAPCMRHDRSIVGWYDCLLPAIRCAWGFTIVSGSRRRSMLTRCSQHRSTLFGDCP